MTLRTKTLLTDTGGDVYQVDIFRSFGESSRIGFSISASSPA